MHSISFPIQFRVKIYILNSSIWYLKIKLYVHNICVAKWKCSFHSCIKLAGWENWNCRMRERILPSLSVDKQANRYSNESICFASLISAPFEDLRSHTIYYIYFFSSLSLIGTRLWSRQNETCQTVANDLNTAAI